MLSPLSLIFIREVWNFLVRAPLRCLCRPSKSCLTLDCFLNMLTRLGGLSLFQLIQMMVRPHLSIRLDGRFPEMVESRLLQVLLGVLRPPCRACRCCHNRSHHCRDRRRFSKRRPLYDHNRNSQRCRVLLCSADREHTSRSMRTHRS